MRKLAWRRLALIAAALLLAAPAVPSLASAQMRDFTGRIDKVTKKKIIVDNRMGDKVTFVYAKDETAVEGTKSEWSKLKTKDWVTVSWKFIDKPRKAYKVVVFECDHRSGSSLTSRRHAPPARYEEGRYPARTSAGVSGPRTGAAACG